MQVLCSLLSADIKSRDTIGLDTGYWKLENGEVMMHTWDGKCINVRDSEDMLYTMENMACNDWEIVTEYHEVK